MLSTVAVHPGSDGVDGVTGLAGNSGYGICEGNPSGDGGGETYNVAINMNPGEMTWENALDNPWTSNVIYVHETDHYGNDM